MVRTQIAFVLRRKHTATSVGLARHNKLARHLGNIPHFDSNPLMFAIQLRYLGAQNRDLIDDFGHLFVRFGDFSVSECALVIFRYFSNLRIGQYFPAMNAIVFFHEGRVQRGFGKLDIPFVAAFHTMGVRRDTRKISSYAFFT